MADPSLLEKVAQLVHASLRPLPPRYGDGRYNSDVSPETIKTGIVKDLASQATRIPEDIDILVNAIAVLYRNGLQDDSKYLVSDFCYWANYRWKRSFSSCPRFRVHPPYRFASRTVLSQICGMSSFIHLCRMSATFTNTALLMGPTMYSPSYSLISEHHVSSSRKGGR